MAYFAKLGIGGIVERVEVVSDDIAITEQAGIDFLRNLYKDIHTQWAQTYTDKSFRKHYAGMGFYFDNIRNAFIPPKPFNSWILNEDTCDWQAPVAMPVTELESNQYYSWNESITNWEIKTK